MGYETSMPETGMRGRPMPGAMMAEKRDAFAAAARVDPAAFAEEQARLGLYWTYLGLESEIPNQNDWFTTRLGGRSIFVQRFEEGIRAFENRCAHRAFPLRNGAKGHGPIVCGYHHWRYNAEGLALGIPNCLDMFGKPPRALDARLERVEIGQLGPMLFGRFAGGPTISLEEWLGEGAPILAHLMALKGAQTGTIDREVAANWRYIYEITLDDYHIVAVHPSTFGKNGYLPVDIIRYFRFGAHSAYMPGGGPGAFEDLVRACREGTFRPHRYRIFQFFPNLVIALIKAMRYGGDDYWFINVQHLVPLAPDRTLMVSRFFPLAHPPTSSALRRAFRAWNQPFMAAGLNYYAKRVHHEDNAACEKLQTIARRDEKPPLVAMQEARITWLAQTYDMAMEGGLPSPETMSLAGI